MAASTAPYEALPSDTASPREVEDEYALRSSSAVIDTPASRIHERLAAPDRRDENPCNHYRYEWYLEHMPYQNLAAKDREPNDIDAMFTADTPDSGVERS